MVASDDLPLEPEFIDDIGAFFEAHVTPEKSVDAVLNEMREKLQQYSLAENRALNRHQTLSQQEVHLKKSLDCVMMLTAKKETEDDTVVDYALGANIFAKAKIPPTSRVSIWLGAEIMVQYDLDEAKEMLETNLKKCRESISGIHEEWTKIKDCKTTLEVSIARCYNFAVEKQKAIKASQGSG